MKFHITLKNNNMMDTLVGDRAEVSSEREGHRGWLNGQPAGRPSAAARDA
jgi:hypothetical protein